MAKEKNIFDPNIILPKLKPLKSNLGRIILKRKKLFTGIVIILVLLLVISFVKGRKTKTVANTVKTVKVNIDKGFEFSALDNQGKSVLNKKIEFKIKDAEKTNQVTVKDQVFTAKNNKIFLIVNLELKNDASQALNIIPGDLIRLTYNGDEEKKFAPDLHNNLVSVAPISTKIDRVGFVIPQETREFKLYVGELEGKKEEVLINFPS